MSKSINILDKDYLQWIKELSSRYRRSQVKASLKVNKVMLQFYWELGKDIVEKKAESRWGSGFMKNLSRDLKEINPDATCFSVTNLLYMKNFYLLYQPYLEITPQVGEHITQQSVEQEENAITPQLGEQIQKDIFSIGWGHHKVLIDKYSKQPQKALFFVHQTVENGWSWRSSIQRKWKEQFLLLKKLRLNLVKGWNESWGRVSIVDRMLVSSRMYIRV